jgi:hypothetical protein
MIAKGVRFNAEKKQVGNYYSTKVQLLVAAVVASRAMSKMAQAEREKT